MVIWPLLEETSVESAVNQLYYKNKGQNKDPTALPGRSDLSTNTESNKGFYCSSALFVQKVFSFVRHIQHELFDG